ncbi:MAG: hypothetical protein AcusKO_22930 [Acuticoccus sp.]
MSARHAALCPAATLEGSAGRLRVHGAAPAGAAAGAVLVAHGRNGAADQAHITPVVAACLARDYWVAVPDLCYSAANDSAGPAAGFTMTAHLADVRTVLDWAAAQPAWATGGPRIAAGHSMGAYAVLRLAAETAAAGTITGVMAISPVIAGRALIAARERMGPHALAALSAELPGAFAEWPRHDMMPLASRITQPAAVIVGADDTLTTPQDAKTLADALPNLVHSAVLGGEHHCPLGADYAASLAVALDRLTGRAA